MRQLLFVLSAFLLLITPAFAQHQHRDCGAMEVLNRQLQENPLMQQVRDQIEQRTQQFIQGGAAQERIQVTIPVVVHVVWNTTTENISDAQIQTQIEVLNDDFRRLNADAVNTPSVWQGIAADCEINFCMATQDPNGNATNGIVRVQTSSTSFGTDDKVKSSSTGGSNIWDRDKYLNIWVCDLSGTLLGYAQFPGGPASTDGVVCDYQYFGTIGTATQPFHLGRTATHEVGHWLNLYHIWGDDGTGCTGSDQVSDTPNQGGYNAGCPTFPKTSCSNGPNGDMFMNYMDYSDDACMNLFTAGQKSRSQALFASGGFRAPLLNSNGCQAPSGCSAPSGLSASNITETSATVSWNAVSGATGYNLQYKVSTSNTWTTISNISGASQNLTGLTAITTYNYQVQTICSGGVTSNYSSAASFTTAGSCPDQFEPNNSRSGAYQTTPINQEFNAKIATSTDKDWYRFATTNTEKNIRIDLTNLPADYDLKMYRGATQIGVSENGGTTSEFIIKNNLTVRNDYYAYVYGWNGAFNSTICYTLKVSRSATAFRDDGSTDGPVTELEIPVYFENAAFGLFPNPAAGQVTVEIPLEEQESEVTVTLFDVSGRQAKQQQQRLTKGENRVTLELGGIANGVYFVQVQNGDMKSTRKLIVNQ